jgi:hypothetical protein
LNNIRHEASKHFRYKKREYLKDKINEVATHSTNKNIRDLYRGINKFNKGYQSTTYLVKDENGDQLADFHNILNRWRNYFSQLLNVHRVSDVRQIEIHTAEPSIPEPSPFEIETAIANSKKGKLLGSDLVLAELIQAGGETLWSEIYKLINSILSKDEFPDQWKSLLLYQFTRRAIKLTVATIEKYHSSTSYKSLSSILLSKFIPYADNIIGDCQCAFNVTDQLLIWFFAFIRYWRKNWSTIRQYISYS